jgi:type II secretion system protein C
MSWQAVLLRIKDTITFSQILTGANVLMVGILAWSAGGIIASVVENEFLQIPHQEAKFVPPKQKIQDRPRRFSEFRDILEQNIFNVEVKTEKKPEVVEEIPVIAPGKALSDLINDLELKGIHYRKNYYIFCVIKQKKKRKEDIFTIGDELFESGAVIHRIFTTFGNQRVLIKLGNEIGTLTTEEDEKLKQASPAPKVAKRKQSRARKVEPAVSNKYSTDGRNFYITATEVDTHLNDFGALLNQARMVPYFKNGKHQGFRVKAIDKGSLYEKLGLRNNDVIKTVNGESLADAGGEKIMGLFNLLRNEREFTIQIDRSGRAQTLNYFVN